MEQLMQETTPKNTESKPTAEGHPSSSQRRRHHRRRSQAKSYSSKVITAIGISGITINTIGIWYLALPLLRYLPGHVPARLLFFLSPIFIVSIWCLIVGIAFLKRRQWSLFTMTITDMVLVLYGCFLFQNLPSMKNAEGTFILANIILFCILIDRRVIAGFERRKSRHLSKNQKSTAGQEILKIIRGTETMLGRQLTAIGESPEEQQRWLAGGLKAAGFPYVKTLEEFDFSFQPELDEQQVVSLFELAFLEKHENLFFIGPPGVGKTHLAIALAGRACLSGKTVAFTTMSDLIEKLKADKAIGKTDHRQPYYEASLVVVDEVGYSPVTREDSLLFYHFVATRYERASTVFTSNTAIGDWADIFEDPGTTTAIIDRLLHHCVIVKIEGKSYRLKDKQA